jgi:ribonuclease M5
LERKARDSCGKSKSRETPQERSDEEAPGLPAESEVPGAPINREVQLLLEEEMKIKEIIVVEGKDDTTAIKRAVDADTIETNGSAINQETIEKIRRAQKTRGVIIFTDPDFPGEKIRNTISREVSGCKHAFLSKEDAIARNGKGLGVEHASLTAIREALSDVQLMSDVITEEITQEDLLTAGLIGGEGAKERRILLGKLLKIGYTNGKQLHKRLMMFQISQQEFAEALAVVMQEEKG